MSAARVVRPEWLDALPSSDPRAIRSRGDLRRINRLMSAASLLAAPLRAALARTPGAPVVEIGAGDGTLLLRVARRLGPRRIPSRVLLLDMQPVVEAATLVDLDDLGWRTEVVPCDVFDWLPRLAGDDAEAPIVLANLFVHHFEDDRLRVLLRGLARGASTVILLEPRRSRTALLGARLLGLIGSNAVTRHDAVVSVHAGFDAGELTALWPRDPGWRIEERAAGWFGHRLVAIRERP